MVYIKSRSYLAGIMVGIGVIVNMSVDNRAIGAMLFSLALLTIIHNDLYLFTGKIGSIKKIESTDLCEMLVCNLIGSMLVYVVMITADTSIHSAIVQIAIEKFGKDWWELLLLGTMCGILMQIAVSSENTIITVFCIMTFILSGYEHCIADWPYLLSVFSYENALKFLAIVIGNSFGAILTYRLMNKEE